MKYIFILILIAITGAIGFTLFIFMSPSHYMQKVGDHLMLDKQWQSVTPPKPLLVKYRNQELSLRVDNVRDWEVNDEKNPTGFIDPEGNDIVIEAELIDSNGKKYRAKNLDVRRGITLSHSGVLPADVTIETVRMRSSEPLKALSLFWVCYSSK